MEQKKEQIEKINIYDAFTCIADQCPITCCQEWKIAVDDDTFQDWKHINATESELGKNTTKDSKLSDFVTYKEETRVIALQDDMKCPFLNRQKLCRLVMEHGEKMISKTCQLFPRQINDFDETHKGYALMTSCPAVIDLLQEQEQISIIQNHADEIPNEYVKIRNILFDLIQNAEITIEEALQTGFIMLLEILEEQDGNGDISQKVSQCIDQSYHNGILKSIRKMKFQPVYTFEECNELLLDLVENYREQGIYKSYLEPMSELAEAYCEEDEKKIKKELEEFLPYITSYKVLLRKYLATEIFANLYLPDYTLEDVIMAYEWIAMEYATIRHGIFLQWKLQNKGEITFEQVKKSMVMISRMTGYDAEDMQEYLENSFEEPIWEWGYLGLITGK